MQAFYRDDMCLVRQRSAGNKVATTNPIQYEAGVLTAASLADALDQNPDLRDAVAKALSALDEKRTRKEG